MKNQLYAPTKQQIEGLTFILEHVSFGQFSVSLDVLQAWKLISKSLKHRLIKKARRIVGISYAEYITKYKAPF